MTKKSKLVRVSDHAVIRYLERAKGFNFDQVRGKIQRAAQTVLDLGAADITVDGVQFIIDGHGLVITTLDKRPPHLRGKIKQTTVYVD